MSSASDALALLDEAVARRDAHEGESGPETLEENDLEMAVERAYERVVSSPSPELVPEIRRRLRASLGSYEGFPPSKWTRVLIAWLGIEALRDLLDLHVALPVIDGTALNAQLMELVARHPEAARPRLEQLAATEERLRAPAKLALSYLDDG